MLIIFSYNRPQALLHTLHELQGVDQIVVIDDGSRYDFSEHETYCRYIRFDHEGREGFWKHWNSAFGICKNSGDDRFVFIPDDWNQIDTGRIYGTFDKLGDSFACNVTNCGWQRSWTPVPKYPSNVNGYFRVGWVDHGMITTRRVLKKLKWKVNPVSAKHLMERSSSGVGKELSKRLFNLGVPMFTPFISMAKHQGIPSQMHPERKVKVEPK